MKRQLKRLMAFVAFVALCGAISGCSEEDHQTPPPLDGNGDSQEDLSGYPKGLTVKDFTDPLSGGAQCLGFYAVADFKANPKLLFCPQHAAAKKPSRYFSDFSNSQQGTPYVVVNGGFFAGKPIQSLSLLISGGKTESIAVQQDYIWKPEPPTPFFPVRAALGQLDNGAFEAAWIYCVADDGNRPYAFTSALDNDEKQKKFMPAAPTSKTAGGRKWTPREAIGAGPMLVYEGRNVAEENYWKEVFDCGGLAGLSRQPRSAIGATADGKLVVLVCDGRKKRGSAGFTLPELADKMIALGCVMAVNLDGGGSSTFVGREGKVLNMPSDTPGTDPAAESVRERSVPTAVVIAER